MRATFLATIAVFSLGLTMRHAQDPPASQQAAPAHVSNSFHFQVNASLSEAAPLFGPEGERSWAGEHWNPQFLYPQAAPDAELDVPGAVFILQRGPHTMIWVTTIFDVAAGRMQYVAFVPGHMVSVIDVRLSAIDAKTTSVEVTYTRTALDPGANDEVRAHGSDDSQSGPEWQQAIEASLKTHGQRAP